MTHGGGGALVVDDADGDAVVDPQLAARIGVLAVEEMRGLIEQMGVAADAGDYDELVDMGDTLLMLIQQHNQKEEQMLYPMAERALSDEWAKILDRLSEY